MAGAWVQDDTNADDSGGSSTTIAKAFASNVTTGNLIVVFVGWGSNSTATCADSLGNTYTEIHALYDAVNDQKQGAFYAKNITGGACTVTVTFSVSEPNRRLYIGEQSGANTTAPLDQAAIAVFTGGAGTDANTSGNMPATTNANDFIWGFTQDIGFWTGGMSAGTNYTGREQISSVIGIIGMGETRNVSATGTYAATFTDATGNRMITSCVAFKDTGGAAASQPWPWQLKGCMGSMMAQ